ncbi:MAG: ABC transporter permease [Chitinophagales bacterium]|nr:ABC transporter permease [Chitinophagales bacterium]
MGNNELEQEWSQVIEPTSNPFTLNVGELWRYRDLIILFVKRDFVSVYKQTVLGPLWHFLQPLFTTLVYWIFGGLAGLPTDGLPRILFLLTGVVIWNYFAACLTKTSNTFIGNAHIFGKVYFPRLAIPISVIISNLMSFFIQLLLVVPFLVYYHSQIQPNVFLLALPFLIIVIAMMGLGFGIIVSSLTIKYRDLVYLISFGVQLAMYAAPVIYPLSMIPERYRWIASLNPLTPLIEAFRYALMGRGTFTAQSILYSTVFAVVVLLIGIVLFNRAEKDFMDTV